MAQKIIRLCDVCMTENRDEREVEPETIGYGGRSFGLDLCDQHRAELLKPLLDALDLYGTPLGRDGAPKPARSRASASAGRSQLRDETTAVKRSRPGPKAPTGDPMAPGVHPCPIEGCPAVYSGSTGDKNMRRHMIAAHDHDGSIGAALGYRCPVCGDTFARAGQSSLAAHTKSTHRLTMSQAIVEARRTGDPFGLAALFPAS